MRVHMQVKPAQRYFRHEKKKKCTNTEETKHDINCNSTPCAYNSCENLIKWNNKIQFIFALLAFDHPPNLWLQSASKLFRLSPRLFPNTDIVGTSSTPKWASKPSNNNTRSCIFRLLSFQSSRILFAACYSVNLFSPSFFLPTQGWNKLLQSVIRKSLIVAPSHNRS